MVYAQGYGQNEKPQDEKIIHPGDKVSMSAGTARVPSDQFQNVMMEKPVSELLKKNSLLVVAPNDSVEKIVQILQKEKKSCVIVSDQDQMLGVVSKRDLLRRTAGMETKLFEIRAFDVMTANPEVVKATDPIAFAVNKMAIGGFRHLPVLSGSDKPIGIVSIQDVLSYLAQL